MTGWLWSSKCWAWGSYLYPFVVSGSRIPCGALINQKCLSFYAVRNKGRSLSTKAAGALLLDGSKVDEAAVR